jgi:hypothetical protein
VAVAALVVAVAGRAAVAAVVILVAVAAAVAAPVEAGKINLNESKEKAPANTGAFSYFFSLANLLLI